MSDPIPATPPDAPRTRRAPDEAPVVRIRIPRIAVVGAAVAGLVALALIGVLVAQLQATRHTIEDDIATRLARVESVTGTLGAGARPVLRDATKDRDAARRLTGLSTTLATRATPLVRSVAAADPARQLRLVGALGADLEGHDAGRQIQQAGRLGTNLLRVDAGAQLRTSADLARSLLGADVGPTVTDVRGLASTLRSADVPGLSSAVTGVTDELGTQDRLRRVLVRLAAVLGQARTTDLVPVAAAAARAVPGTIVPELRRTNAMLAETLRLTRDTNALTRDTNGHVVNLDRKLGGEARVP